MICGFVVTRVHFSDIRSGTVGINSHGKYFNDSDTNVRVFPFSPHLVISPLTIAIFKRLLSYVANRLRSTHPGIDKGFPVLRLPQALAGLTGLKALLDEARIYVDPDFWKDITQSSGDIPAVAVTRPSDTQSETIARVLCLPPGLWQC